MIQIGSPGQNEDAGSVPSSCNFANTLDPLPDLGSPRRYINYGVYI